MITAIERTKTKYISHGVLMLKNTSREASVVRAVSNAAMAPMMATGMTSPPKLARRRVPFPEGWPPGGRLSGNVVMFRIPERSLGATAPG